MGGVGLPLLHFIEIENFKRFGDKQRIELTHPAVLIGPNNCGKTSIIQALSLWSQAVKTWFAAKRESKATERTSTALNRLNIVSVPVQRTRFFWHNTNVRIGNKDIQLNITVGVFHQNQIVPLTMRFRNQGDELVYCTPDEKAIQDLSLIEQAASIRVELLYPMSGLETEEPILQPGRIDVLLGQGQTAQVLRNLCLMVHRASTENWEEVRRLMNRLFQVDLGVPRETARGAIELQYQQRRVKEALDISMAGRGFQQMLLIFAYLYSHKGSVLLVDEPDAHLEILRQKQVYVLLRDIATANQSQVVMATHSEVILSEALDQNLILILDGRADNLARKAAIGDTLKIFGADTYVKARDRGYILYVEGGSDIDMLRGLAEHLQHPVIKIWDERVNSVYTQNNYSSQDLQAELERVEGGYGVTPQVHFRGLRNVLPELQGLAILDSDGQQRQAQDLGPLTVLYWERYETENYFVNPDALRRFAKEQLGESTLFAGFQQEIEEVLAEVTQEKVFGGVEADFRTYANSPADAARLIWEAKTQNLKLSLLAEEFFRRLAQRIGGPMLLTKGELHRLIPYCDGATIPAEVNEKLDHLQRLFAHARVDA